MADLRTTIAHILEHKQHLAGANEATLQQYNVPLAIITNGKLWFSQSGAVRKPHLPRRMSKIELKNGKLNSPTIPPKSIDIDS